MRFVKLQFAPIAKPLIEELKQWLGKLKSN